MRRWLVRLLPFFRKASMIYTTPEAEKRVYEDRHRDLERRVEGLRVRVSVMTRGEGR